jgi:hypothetical protein
MMRTPAHARLSASRADSENWLPAADVSPILTLIAYNVN